MAVTCARRRHILYPIAWQGMRSTTLVDIMHPLDTEREARQRNKRRRTAQQMQAELRMVARHVNEERLTRSIDLTP